MRRTTCSLAIIAACATGAAMIAALAPNASASQSFSSTAARVAVTHPVKNVAGKALPAKPSSTHSHTRVTAAATTHYVKPLLTGLLNRGGAPPAAYRTAEGGYVIQGVRGGVGNPEVGGVAWAELQLTAGGPITANNPIDQAITDVRAWNLANPTHKEGLKLRVEAGIHSPAWALNLGGQCFTVTDPSSGTSGCSPRFWTAQFSAAYYQFEAELAAKYDSVPEIREVDMAKNVTVYDESLIRQVQSPTSVAAMLAAGYSTSVDEQQQIRDIALLGTYWKHTSVGFAFNPYQTVNPISQDEAFTQQLIASGRKALGALLVLENDSIRQSYVSGNGTYQTMYAFMTQTGGPIGFQTATLAKVGSIQAVVTGAVSMGAASIELPTGYVGQFSPAQLMVLGRPVL